MISVFVIAAIIVAIKGLQFISKSRSPLSWAFDMFLDHHGGPGGSTARTLHLILTGCIRPGKLFYDVDSFQRNHNVAVVMDAAKLSKHFSVCLSSETWSRHWCVAGVISAVQWNAEMTVVTMAEEIAWTKRDGLPSLHAVAFEDTDVDEICRIKAKKAPRHLLRPYGLGDQTIVPAMKRVFGCRQNVFAMADKASAESHLQRLFDSITVVQLRSREISPKFFETDTSSMTQAVCLSCDHADAEAVSVSRLFGFLLSDNVKDAAKMLVGSSHKRKDASLRRVSLSANKENASVIKSAIDKLSIVQDIDLNPEAFAGMVKGGKLPAVVTIITEGSFKSTPQLLRLGFNQQFNTAGFRPHPVAICEVYSFPDIQALKDLREGKVLALGTNKKAAVKAFLTEQISYERVVLALAQVLEARAFICNCPVLTEARIKETLIVTIMKCAESLSIDVKKPPAEEQADVQEEVAKQDSISEKRSSVTVCPSRWMRGCTEEEKAGSADTGLGEDIFV
jgi:hypothetical protein